MTTQTILLDAKALAGELDYGHFQILYRKLGKQINWREAQPRIPYCTRHGGSFVDPLTGITWSVSSCGLIERDRLLDKDTYDVGMLLLMDNRVYYQKDVAEFWYRYEKEKWVPQKYSPWQHPGVTVEKLRPATEYEFACYWTNSKGAGPRSDPIVWTTADKPSRRLDITIIEEVANA
jgi:hypothetical protein